MLPFFFCFFLFHLYTHFLHVYLVLYLIYNLLLFLLSATSYMPFMNTFCIHDKLNQLSLRRKCSWTYMQGLNLTAVKCSHRSLLWKFGGNKWLWKKSKLLCFHDQACLNICQILEFLEVPGLKRIDLKLLHFFFLLLIVKSTQLEKRPREKR